MSKEDISNMALFNMISNEIDAIEALVQLQNRKIESLSKLRSEIAAKSYGMKSYSPEYSSVKAADLHVADPILQTSLEIEAPKSSKSIHSVIDQLVKIFTPYEIIDARSFFVKHSGGSRGKLGPYEQLTAVISTNGTLHIYDLKGAEQISFDLGHKGLITAVSIDSNDARFSLLTTAAEDGSIHVTKIRRSPKDKTLKVSVDSTFSILARMKDDEAISDPSIAQQQPFVTSIFVGVKSQRATAHVIYAGDSTGRLLKLGTSGNQIGVLEPTSEQLATPVVDLAVSSNSLVYARGSLLQMVVLNQFKEHKIKCRLPEPIVSARFDDRLPWSVLVTLRSGAVTMLSLRKVAGDEEGEESTCSSTIVLASTAAMPPSSPPPLTEVLSDATYVAPKSVHTDGSIAPVRGYFIATHVCALSLFNNSESQGTSLSAETILTESYLSAGCVPSNPAPTSSKQCNALIVTSGSGGGGGGLFGFGRNRNNPDQPQPQQCTGTTSNFYASRADGSSYSTTGFTGLRADVVTQPSLSSGSHKGFLSFLMPSSSPPPKKTFFLTAYNKRSISPTTTSSGEAFVGGGVISVYSNTLVFQENNPVDYVYYIRLGLIVLVVPFLLYLRFRKSKSSQRQASPNSRFGRAGFGRDSKTQLTGPAAGRTPGAAAGKGAAAARKGARGAASAGPAVSLESARSMTSSMESQRQSMDELYAQIEKISSQMGALNGAVADADDSEED